MNTKKTTTSHQSRSGKNAGNLDPTFGDAGVSTIPDPQNKSQTLSLIALATDPASQVDQRLYVCGTTDTDGYVVRLLGDGEIDERFGEAGYVKLPLDPQVPSWTWTVDTFIFLNSGRIIVWGILGTVKTTGVYFVPTALCISSEGMIDTSFGENGLGIYDLFIDRTPINSATSRTEQKLELPPAPNMNKAGERASSQGAKGIELDDGKLLLVGSTKRFGSLDIVSYLIIINSDGSLDTAFGQDGAIVIKDPNVATMPDYNSYSIDRRGGIVFLGSHMHSPQPCMVVRFDSEGHRDPDFGTDGVAYIANPNGHACWARDVMALDDGKVIALVSFMRGEIDQGLGQDGAVIKILNNGNPDPDFNNGAPVIIDLTPPAYVFAFSLNVDDGKRIIVGGRNSPDNVGFVTRIMPNGSMDAGFGSNGTAELEGIQEADITTIQSRVNIISLGYSHKKLSRSLIRVLG